MTHITTIDTEKRKRSRRPKRRPRLRPRLGSIKAAEDYSGMGHSKLYEEAARVPGLFVKWHSATRVDFDVLDRIIDALPAAQIRAASK
jgi:hypothetical protein